LVVDLRSGKASLLLPHATLGWTLLPVVKINDSQLLWEFGLWAFFFCLLAQFSEVSNSQSERFGDVWPLVLDDRDLFREFELQAFTYSTSACFLLEYEIA
jgi:hypothetical protein